MKRLLILKRDSNNSLTRNTNECSVADYYRVRYNNIFLRIVRKCRLYCLIGPFLGKWKNNLNHCQTIIMFDNGYHKVIARYIKKKQPNCKIILWFWNPIFSENKKYLKDDEINEVWSYDKNDCKKYGLKYNTQFFNRENVVSGDDTDYDLVFVGAEKNRKEKLNKIVSLSQKEGLRTKIIIPQKKSDYLNYKEYMKLVGNSKAILEVMNADATGLTLRSLESLFCEKKLVTNNTEIADYDFYYPENIFIIGKDNPKNLKKFIETPYRKVNESIVDYYEFENWVKRFEGKEKK